MQHSLRSPRGRSLRGIAPSLGRAVLGLALALCVPASSLVAAQGHGADHQRIDEAIRHQVALLEEKPHDPRLLVDLGNLLVLAGRQPEAEAVYRKVLGDDPTDVDALYNLALLLQESGRSEEALELHLAVIEVAPRTAWSHYQIGRIFEAQGRRTPALEAYVEAFSLDPELGFPDVNPHVLENQLATEALLRSNKQVLEGESAPRSYADGGRIALLLAAPEESAADEDAEDAPGDVESAGDATETSPLPDSGAAATKTTYRARPSADAVPSDPAAELSRRVDPPSEPTTRQEPLEGESATRLGPDDLRQLGRANRADPPTEGESSPSVTRSRAGAVRTTPPPRRPAPSRPSAEAAPPSSQDTPPSSTGSRFRPGRRSSAQLDLELLPSRPAGAPAPAPAP